MKKILLCTTLFTALTIHPFQFNTDFVKLAIAMKYMEKNNTNYSKCFDRSREKDAELIAEYKSFCDKNPQEGNKIYIEQRAKELNNCLQLLEKSNNKKDQEFLKTLNNTDPELSAEGHAILQKFLQLIDDRVK